MFGIRRARSAPVSDEQVLIELLDRSRTIDSLEALERSIHSAPVPDTAIDLATTAVALDANIFLRLAGHAKAAEVSDYLNSEKHTAPLVIPGQIIQEYWNNQLSQVQTVSKNLDSQLRNILLEIEKLDPSSALHGDLEAMREKISHDYGYIFDAAIANKTKRLISSLKVRAIVPYARRSSFITIAKHRKDTKTPPGFLDTGHGDFFVWVDLLMGLQKAKANGARFSNLVLVTNDAKPDWVRNGIPHPILTSEVQALFGVPFDIWKLDRFVKEVGKALA